MTATHQTDTRPLTIPPGMGMRYTSETLDRKTGEVVSIDNGDWITMQELSQLLGLGRRQLGTVLRELDFIQIEGGKNVRHRIRDWVIAKGFGKRNRRRSDDMPFDVVSPAGIKWIADRWQEAHKAVERRTTIPVTDARDALREFKSSRERTAMRGQEEVCWLADHFPRLTHDQIAQALHLSRQLVSRLMKLRSDQLSKARSLRDRYREPHRDTTEHVA